MNDRQKSRMRDAGMAALFGLAVIVVSFIPPLGVLLLPGLLPALIFFPQGVHSDHAEWFIPVLVIFSFLIWSGLTFALIRLARRIIRWKKGPPAEVTFTHLPAGPATPSEFPLPDSRSPSRLSRANRR